MRESANPDRGRLDRAERLFEMARALPPSGRTEFIETSCSDDPALRDDLCELLAHGEAAEAFFERLADAVPIAGSIPPIVDGRYEIAACIGTGGMGAVFRAHDRRLQRDVALKFLPPYFALAPDAEEVLLREARAAASLEHANVCTIHEVSTTEDGRPFISMALYEGETLNERLHRGPISAGEAVDIARQIARGLAAAHARGIVHRDVKPGNVMILRDGTVKLLDFGIARLGDAAVGRLGDAATVRLGDAMVTRPGGTRGTVAYMSPEQARGESVGERSDLFSLGVLLYEMVAGAHPFRAGKHIVLHAIMHEEPVPLRERKEATPRALEGIVTRLLRKEPEARYAGAAELLADLDALAPTSTRSRPGLAVGKRGRVRLGATVGIAVIVAGAIARDVASRRSAADAPGASLASASAGLAADAPVNSPRMIAVLPFANLDGDSAQDYLVDGLTEELIGALSRVDALRVVARGSAFAFNQTDRDTREIGRALGVSAILEGSVQRVGDRTRVRAELVNVADGRHLWPEAYDREVTDIFAVQRDLALRIASAMQAGLSPAEQAQVGQRRNVSPEAFALYLKGRHFWNQRTSSGFALARDYYLRAIDADSQFAAAYAGLAVVYSLQGHWGDLPSAVARERMRDAATKAVQLDDGLAEAHSVLGVFNHVYEWDSNAAERHQRRAIELDPKLVAARYFYGNMLSVHGRLDEALAQYRIAAELDPLDQLTGEAIGRTLVLAGRLDEAKQHMLGAMELDSMFWYPHRGLGIVHEVEGELETALRDFRRAMELGGSRIHVARLLARTGREREARQMLAEMQAQATRTRIHAPGIATILYALGDMDGAIAWLERAYAERHPTLRFISGHPEFAPLEADPRYLDLLRRIGVRG